MAAIHAITLENALTILTIALMIARLAAITMEYAKIRNAVLIVVNAILGLVFVNNISNQLAQPPAKPDVTIMENVKTFLVLMDVKIAITKRVFVDVNPVAIMDVTQSENA